jgi:hypothetical protein
MISVMLRLSTILRHLDNLRFLIFWLTMMLRVAVPPGSQAQIDLAGRAGKESKAGWGEQLSMYRCDIITTLMVLCRRLQNATRPSTGAK